jgi:hypothetical protein
MTSAETAPAPRSASLLPAIITGGLLAGALDGASAFYTFGAKMPLGIASGLLGSKAFSGGAEVWLLGLVCHFIVALGSAAVYCLASERLVSFKQHFLVGGIICGIGVFLVMNVVVLPLSAVPFPVGPFSVSSLRTGFLFHTLLVGLPISLSLWFFSRRRRLAA